MGEVTESLQRKFPSPRGVPVFEGVVGRSDPVRLRVRVFPHGARVGLMRATTRERPIKPTLSGTLSHQGGTSTLAYTITSRTGSVGSVVVVSCDDDGNWSLSSTTSLIRAVPLFFSTSVDALGTPANIDDGGGEKLCTESISDCVHSSASKLCT